MGKIAVATVRVQNAFEAMYLETIFDLESESAAKEVDLAVRELKNALSDFLGKSVILKIEISFSLTPDHDGDQLHHAASELEKTNSTTFQDALGKFFLLLKLAIGAESITLIW
jgi:hypothetical protein